MSPSRGVRRLWDPFIRELRRDLCPDRCGLCGEVPQSQPDVLCDGCRQRVSWLDVFGCRLCQDRPPLRGSDRCGPCRAERSLSACLGGASYEGPLVLAIQRFKYPGRRFARDVSAERLAIWLTRLAAAQAGTEPDWVVCVPQHPRRLAERGFAPSVLLARAVAKGRGLSFAAGALSRLRDTPSQTGLTRAARERNLRGAFRATRELPTRIWLVDDVVTTGATMREAARALREGGAERVIGIAAARTPLAR